MSINLRINTENSHLNTRTVDAKMNIQGQEGEFDLKKQKGSFKIKQKYDEIDIDNYRAYKQLNLESPQDLMKSQVSKAQQKAKSALSSYVRDGEALMKIENKGNPIIQIAEKNAFKHNDLSLNVEHYPRDPIEVKVREGYLQVEAELDKFQVNSKSNLKIDVTPGGVYTTATKPKLSIEAIGELYDSKI